MKLKLRNKEKESNFLIKVLTDEKKTFILTPVARALDHSVRRPFV